MASSLLNVTKNILREAAKIGIEEAGTRLCGPRAWSVVKKVLSPVIEELERRYPKLLLVPAEMEKAERDLSDDETLEALLRQQLVMIREGHREILGVLFQYEETLRSYRELFFRAIEEADKKNEARHEHVIAEIGGVKMEIAGLLEQISRATVQPTLSLDEIYKQANGYQMDAMKWISAGDASAASQRLATARALAMGGLARDEGNARLMVTLGFIEKSQAQASTIRNDPEGATENLALAAKYFAKAMALDPTNLDALNGMANVYYYGRDYDSAIQLGIMVVKADPTHGPALNDLSLALEEKIKESGPEPHLVGVLITVYEILEQLMPLQPQVFPATYLAHVQRRLAYFRSIQAAAPSAVDYFLRGNALVAAGDYEHALEAYEQALALQPQFPEADLYRGIALLSLGRSQEGLEAAEQALTHIQRRLADFRDIQASAVDCFLRGNALVAAGDYEHALEAYGQALALRADYAEAHSARGAVLLGLGRHQEALEEIERALALRPDYPEAMYNKACAYSLLNDAEVALDWLERAIRADQKYRGLARTDPHFAFLREHAKPGSRFRTLLEE